MSMHLAPDSHPPEPAHAPRPASSALTKTGGFLTGFTHTLQPYIGCAFGCTYCYVQGLQVHQCHRPQLPWGDYVHPRVGIDERLTRELGRIAAQGELDRLAIFMSSATDPYQGLERQWRLTRACLDVMQRYPPGLLVVQTRSPHVREDFDRIAALGDRAWLSMTVETDRDDVRKVLTPRCPSLAQRWATLAAAKAAGLQVQIAVSPSLPYTDVDRFADQLAAHADRVIVDTYVSGDGNKGRRTARTSTGDRYAEAGLGDWRAEDSALALYAAVQARMGDRAGWSQAGFLALPKLHAAGAAPDPQMTLLE
jgi:DNA repair photolyase